jgi:uncharacterized protein (DUF697 family)
MASQKSSSKHDPLNEPPAGSAPEPSGAQIAPPHAADAAPMSVEPPWPEASAIEMEAHATPETLDAPDGDAIALRRRKATRVMRRYMVFSAAAGLVPLPAVDVATVTALQVKMLHAMTRLYGVPFNTKLARQLILALIGGGGSMVLSLPAASATKTIPVIGTAAGMLISPAVATMACYGIGRAFISHFEAGGTLETFTPAEVKAEAAA